MIPRRLRRLTALALASCMAAAPTAQAADILGSIKGAVPGMGFSVSGKPGPFVKQVAKRKFEPPTSADVADLGFAGDSRGEFQSARLKMPETEKKIAALISKADGLWPYAHPASIKVHILADGKYGPNALPDGSIAVPVGFLARAESDDEVAFVLGHEYAHLALSHFSRPDRMRNQRRLIRLVAQVYAAGVEISEIRVQQAGDDITFTVDDRKRVDAAQKRAATAKENLDWVLNNLVDPAWNRRQEDEADALGFDLARSMGYAAADGAGGAFVRITADDTAKATMVSQLQGQLKDSLAEAAVKSTSGGQTVPDLDGFKQAFTKSLQAGLRDRGMKALENYLSPKHRTPEVRQKGLSDYDGLAYPGDTSLVELKTTWLKEVRATKEFNSAKTAVNALQTAREARLARNYVAAEKAIKLALATPYGGLPLFTNEAGRIYRDKGDLKSAEAQFTRADAHPDQTLDGFRDHVTMAMGSKSYTRALQIITVYKTRSKTDKDFLPQLIRINFKLKRTEEAVALLQRCMDYDEPKLRDSCAMSAFGPDDAEWDKLPEASRTKITDATGKAASKLSFGVGLQEVIKSMEKSDAT